ncbi:MAG TPA: DUF1501 domain-containing protein [Chthoniobacteraceae bacterium]|jgi:uncharacterized protein (DUF1501 family)|nr:DUF1501 domain-containing protein [Chthoniobacteraceae bacterium]
MPKKSQLLQTRREFLSTGIKGLGLVAASAYVPAFVTRTAGAVPAETDATILVVLQLSGGNDGLNTVVPFANDLYYKARPTIGIPRDATLKINDQIGLHPSLAPLKAEYDAGHMAIIQNTGYPNPNRSHFRSMEIWHTAGDSTGPSLTYGWLGRYFDAQCSGADPHKVIDNADIGVSFGKVMPQAFRNQSNVGLAVDNPNTFQWNASGETLGLAKAQEEIFAHLNQPGGVAASPMSSMATLGAINDTEPATLDFLRHTAMNAMLAGDRIRSILGKDAKHGTAYPQSELGNQLGMIAKLIGGGFPTRVYYAYQGGFDTHANQLGTHARVLADVAQSVHAFRNDLKQQQNSQRVMVVAFSEFGRRVAENGSAGTDHGAAAPVFLFGDSLKAGVHGHAPDLAALTDGDIVYDTDFRSVYATVLERWLGAPSAPLLGRPFGMLPIV